MTKDILIGCDVGTSGTKAVAVTPDGRVLASAHRAHGILAPHPNWGEQWPQVWLDALTQTVAEVAAQVDPARVAGLCVSALYGGTGVMLDAAMQPVRPAIIWIDRRATQESEFVREHIGAEKLFATTANGIDSYFGYIKLLWVKRHEPELYARIKTILPIHSYLVYRLTGETKVDLSAAGNLGGLYDFDRRGWSREMADLLGLDLAHQPSTLCASTDIAGGLTAEFAASLGLAQGTPVLCGTVDCLAAMLSIGCVGEGDNAAILGTSLNWGYLTGKRPSDPNLVSMPYCLSPEKLTYVYGGASTAGALPRWFMQNFVGSETQADYARMEAEAVNIPAGAEGLLLLPYFMGERTPIWDESASGLFMGLSLTHTRGHLYRAILESSAFALRDIIASIAGEMKVGRVYLTGGGAKSPLWRRIFADVTGLTVVSPTNPLEAPMGDAFMAGLATGLIDRPERIASWTELGTPDLPNAQNHERYTRLFEVYRSVYQHAKGDMKALREAARP